MGKQKENRFPGVTKLPNGRWRAVCPKPGRRGTNLSVATVLGIKGATWATPEEAAIARKQAVEKLKGKVQDGATLREFWTEWTTADKYARPKDSTNLHNKERTRGFVVMFGHMPIRDVGDMQVSAWLDGGRNDGTIPALRAMFNDALDPDLGGRLIDRNPFVGRRRRKRGPTKHKVLGEIVFRDPEVAIARSWKMIEAARQSGGPGLAAWFQTGMYAGMRCGELDALRWEDVDEKGGWIHIHPTRGHFCSKTGTFTSPKNGKGRQVPIHHETALALAEARTLGGEFCFVGLRLSHWTQQSRAYHWKAVKAATDWPGDTYLATRHFAGWWMYEHMGIEDKLVGYALGHGDDAGELVRRVYGHGNAHAAMEKVKSIMAARPRLRKAA